MAKDKAKKTVMLFQFSDESGDVHTGEGASVEDAFADALIDGWTPAFGPIEVWAMSLVGTFELSLRPKKGEPVTK